MKWWLLQCIMWFAAGVAFMYWWAGIGVLALVAMACAGASAVLCEIVRENQRRRQRVRENRTP